MTTEVNIDVFSTPDGPVILHTPKTFSRDESGDVILWLELVSRSIKRAVDRNERARLKEKAAHEEIQGLS